MMKRPVGKPLDGPEACLTGSDGRRIPLASPRSNYKWTEQQNALLRIMFDAGAHGDHIAAAINQQTGSSYSGTGVMSHAISIGLRRRGRTTPIVWRPDKNAEFLRRIEATETLSQIAQAMGISYGAARNQFRRLGIKIPQGHRRTAVAEAFHRALMQDRQAAREHQKRLNRLLNFVPGEYRREAPLPIAPDVVTDPLNLSLSEISLIQCHWITNDDLTAPLYCGHATGQLAGKGSWCPAHKKVVTHDPFGLWEKAIPSNAGERFNFVAIPPDANPGPWVMAPFPRRHNAP